MGHKAKLSRLMSHCASLLHDPGRQIKSGHFAIFENYVIIDYLCSHQSKEFLFLLNSRHKRRQNDTRRGKEIPMDFEGY